MNSKGRVLTRSNDFNFRTTQQNCGPLLRFKMNKKVISSKIPRVQPTRTNINHPQLLVTMVTNIQDKWQVLQQLKIEPHGT